MRTRALSYIIIVSLVLITYSALENKSKQPASPNLSSYTFQKGQGAKLSFTSFNNLIDEAQGWIDDNILGIKEENKEEIQTNKSITDLFTIAVLGDSMIDVLGPEVSILKQELEKHYPNATFTIHNAGVGGKDIEDGLLRLTNDYSYLGQNKKAVLSLHPNILILESFAYNHWSPDQSDLDRQWLTIAKIIDETKSRSPGTKIILSATIAPHCPTYTDGSADLPDARKFTQCETVKKYLKNIINFATSQNYPLADAYHTSLGQDNEGDKKYIAGDNIHPSAQGGELFASKIVEAIIKNNLLE